MDRLGVNNDSRESGILMPFRALPGDHDHQGTYGPESTEFLDFMSRANFTALHDLPCTSPDPFDSPYSPDSAFAIDPQRIDLFQLAEVGDINRLQLDQYQELAQSGDEGPAIKELKDAFLKQAAINFAREGSAERHENFARWCQEESEWLDAFAAYDVLKRLPENTEERNWRWQNWRSGRDFSLRLVKDVEDEYKEDFYTLCYAQWIADEQNLRYLQEADQRGIKVWGDVPFYAGHGEVWANREIFNLDNAGFQLNQGGAAPSMTSVTGQMWGFATYKADGLKDPKQTTKVLDWWSRRLARAHKLNSGQVRLDHFIGLAEPYIIAADAADGMNGYRDIGIGGPLLQRLTETYGSSLPFYPEDLGTQTEETPKLRDAFGLFANTLAVRGLTKDLLLGQYRESIHNSDNYHPNSVSFSSNHDMLPLVGTIDDIRSQHPYSFDQYVAYTNEVLPYQTIDTDTPSETIAQREMERVLRSLSKYAFMAVWDVLNLGPEGRYNVPNTIQETNWSWRMDSGHKSNLNGQTLYWRALNEVSGRIREDQETAVAAD